MNMILLFVGAVIIACILLKPIAAKLPFPTLLIFIALGMFLGSGGPLHINFNDFKATESACTAALIFIMFYGGFNTNIERARPVAVPAVLLSTAGVVITAGLTAVFAHVALHFDWPLALLLGSVISSTDAASVFSVLREHRLSLKGGTDSLLEVESGSNDPLAYMLTAVFSALALGEAVNLPVLIAQQIVFGAAFGLAFGWVGMKLACRMNLESQNETIVLIAIALLSFAVPSQLGGNGFLSVYLAGIVLGASDIPSKREMVHVFDALTEMAEMADLLFDWPFGDPRPPAAGHSAGAGPRALYALYWQAGSGVRDHAAAPGTPGADWSGVLGGPARCRLGGLCAVHRGVWRAGQSRPF